MFTNKRFPGKLMGGYAGLATGSAFTVEYQGEATPHAHGFVSLANMYQHHTLEEIGKIIETNHRGVKPDDMLKRVLQFVEHLQREDHFDDDSLRSKPLIKQYCWIAHASIITHRFTQSSKRAQGTLREEYA